MSKRLQSAFAAAAVFLSIFVSSASAHYVWIVRVDGETRICFGERPEPDKAEFLKGPELFSVWCGELPVAASQIKLVTRDSLGWLDVVGVDSTNDIFVEHDYGTFERNGKTTHLRYFAQNIRLRSDRESEVPSRGALSLVPQIEEGQLKICSYYNGGRTPVLLKRLRSDNDPQVVEPIAPGEFSIQPQTGEVALIAKHVVPASGSQPEQAYYCTLVVSVVDPAFEADTNPLGDLPMGLTSFGCARIEERLFVFGGHFGQAHEYSVETQSDDLLELDLRNPVAWRSIGRGPRLQGLALVAHRGNLYRIGGMEARNQLSADQDLHSSSEFARFDFESKVWIPLPNLPSGRSSFDAVVVDNTVYVVGGWELRGDMNAVWPEPTLSFDLANPDSEWMEMASPPTRRRALSIGIWERHLVSVGGMAENGEPVNTVELFDIDRQVWKAGPGLPDQSEMAGFGAACCWNKHGLFVNSNDGGLYRLSDDFSAWELCGRAKTPRFFHRLIVLAEGNFAIFGGANMEIGHVVSSEKISAPQQSSPSKD